MELDRLTLSRQLLRRSGGASAELWAPAPWRRCSRRRSSCRRSPPSPGASAPCCSRPNPEPSTRCAAKRSSGCHSSIRSHSAARATATGPDRGTTTRRLRRGRRHARYRDGWQAFAAALVAPGLARRLVLGGLVALAVAHRLPPFDLLASGLPGLAATTARRLRLFWPLAVALAAAHALGDLGRSRRLLHRQCCAAVRPGVAPGERRHPPGWRRRTSSRRPAGRPCRGRAGGARRRGARRGSDPTPAARPGAVRPPRCRRASAGRRALPSLGRRASGRPTRRRARGGARRQRARRTGDRLRRSVFCPTEPVRFGLADPRGFDPLRPAAAFSSSVSGCIARRARLTALVRPDGHRGTAARSPRRGLGARSPELAVVPGWREVEKVRRHRPAAQRRGPAAGLRPGRGRRPRVPGPEAAPGAGRRWRPAGASRAHRSGGCRQLAWSLRLRRRRCRGAAIGASGGEADPTTTLLANGMKIRRSAAAARSCSPPASVSCPVGATRHPPLERDSAGSTVLSWRSPSTPGRARSSCATVHRAGPRPWCSSAPAESRAP